MMRPTSRAATILWIQRLGAAVSIVSLLAVLRALPAAAILQGVTALVERSGAFGPALYAAAYALITVLMLPAWPLSVAAGALFGLFTGLATVVLGATLGMAGAFLIARYAARGAIERGLSQSPRVAAMDRAIGESGWKIVALLRLSPVVPFNLQNYLYGLTAIRFWPCVGTSAVAIIPGSFMYVYIGFAGQAGLSVAAGGAGERGPGQWLLLAIGLAATIAATLYATRLARRAMEERTPLAAESVPTPAESEAAESDAVPVRGAVLSAVTAAGMVILAVYAHMHSDALHARLDASNASQTLSLPYAPAPNNEETPP